jgi:hypothetical protein
MRGRSYRRWRAAFWAGVGLCIALAVVWGVSLWHGAQCVTLRYEARLDRGAAYLSHYRKGDARFPLGWTNLGGDGEVTWMPYLGWSTVGYAILLPLWIPVLPPAVLAGLAWLRTRPDRPAGRCPECGYSREGLPPDAICPECGHAPG